MRLTENAVFVTAAGAIAYMRSLGDPNRPDNTRAKIREIFDPSTGDVVQAAPIEVKSVGDVFKWLGGFLGLPAKPRSGYDQYYNDYGPTNPKSPGTLTNDGLLKNIVAFTNVLHERAAKGGAEGDEAKATLSLVAAYNDEAASRIVQSERDSLLKQIAAKGFTAEEIAAAKAKASGINPPPATVDAEADAEIAETT